MERLSRTLTACGLSLILSASGCRNVPEVPPGRQVGGGTPTAPPTESAGVGFGSQGHSLAGPAFSGGAPGTSGSAAGAHGVAPSSMNPYDRSPEIPAGLPDEIRTEGAPTRASGEAPMPARPLSLGQPGNR